MLHTYTENLHEWHVLKKDRRLMVIRCTSDVSDGKPIVFGEYSISDYELLYTKVRLSEALKYMADLA